MTDVMERMLDTGQPNGTERTADHVQLGHCNNGMRYGPSQDKATHDHFRDRRTMHGRSEYAMHLEKRDGRNMPGTGLKERPLRAIFNDSIPNAINGSCDLYTMLRDDLPGWNLSE